MAVPFEYTRRQTKWPKRLTGLMHAWIGCFLCHDFRHNADVTHSSFFVVHRLSIDTFMNKNVYSSILNDSIRFANSLMQKWWYAVYCMRVPMPMFAHDLLSHQLGFNHHSYHVPFDMPIVVHTHWRCILPLRHNTNDTFNLQFSYISNIRSLSIFDTDHRREKEEEEEEVNAKSFNSIFFSQNELSQCLDGCVVVNFFERNSVWSLLNPFYRFIHIKFWKNRWVLRLEIS